MRRTGIIFLLLLAGFSARAQFFSSGEDPGRVRWNTISSDNFRIIYPSGTDSLAIQYGLALERHREALGLSIGYAPNSQYRRPMPVILHPFSSQANGSVVWAPRRMDLYTRPQSLAPEPLEWVTELSIHESRHVSQMQFAKGRGFGLFNAVAGDLFTGALAAVYPGPALLEGDAVTAETALTGAGRGRSADFLEHYRISFAAGDFRNWYRWRWGSLTKYTPDHYRAGYMLVAGTRYVYDDPLFTKRYYDNITDPIWPFPFFVLQKTLKQASGKGLKDTWKEIASAQQTLWAADEAARGPFGPARQLTPQGKRYVEYLNPEVAGGQTYAVRQSLGRPPQLVRLLPDGRVSAVRPFAAATSQLRYSETFGRLYWSEKVQDHRWTLKSDSRIYYLVPGSRAVRRLTSSGNLSNPSPSPDGRTLSVTEYPVEGGSAVRIIYAKDGQTIDRYAAPDSLQVVETAWLGEMLLASAISPGGFAFYDVRNGFSPLTDPVFEKVKQLRSGPDAVLFVSDRNGVNELYRLSVSSSADCAPRAVAVRITNHRFGASDFLPGTDSLTFAALTPSGRHLFREPSPSVIQSEAEDLSPWPVADRLSLQESSLSASSSPVIQSEAKDLFTSPKPYRKLPHLLRLHSWAPVFIDYDATAVSTFEAISSSALLGATAFLQNDLGTATAIVGYSATTELTDEGKQWDHSLHGKFTYRGWYPVLEFSADIGSGNARRYLHNTILFDSHSISSIDGKDTGVPSYRLSAKAYIPWDFSSGGWYRGIVPRIEASFSNDIINTSEIYYRIIRIIGQKNGVARIPVGAGEGHVVPLARVTAGLRAYATTGRGRSAIYPRWGIGAEGGLSHRPGATGVFSPAAYFYLYGYVPGIMETHGIRLSAVHQTRFGGKFPETIVNILPRGMGGISGLQTFLLKDYHSQTKASFDYAMPLLPVDWAGLSPLAYVRNFELTLHADGSILSGDSARSYLYSAGADFAVRLANFLWIPYATRIGVSYDHNGGSILKYLAANSLEIPSHNIGFIFTVDLP